jgi:hypothetical protein
MILEAKGKKQMFKLSSANPDTVCWTW